MNAALKLEENTVSETLTVHEVLPGHDSRAIANYFIEKLLGIKKPSKTKERITPLALQKLVFIAHALSLLDLDRPLVNKKPKVGKFDPYFADLQESLSYFGGKTITQKISSGSGEEVYLATKTSKLITSTFDVDEIEILDAIWELYQRLNYDCTRLTYLTGGTHEQHNEMMVNLGLGTDIPDEYIKKMISGRLLHPANHGNNEECAA